jgi:hypothetical protein
LFAGALLIRSVRQCPSGDIWRLAGRVCVGFGLTLVFGSAMHEKTTDLAAVSLLLVIAGAALGAGVYLRSSGLRVYSMVAPALAGSLLLIKHWLGSDSGQPILGLVDDSVFVVSSFTPVMLVYFGYWIVAAILAKRARSAPAWEKAAHWCSGIGLVFLFMSVAHPGTLAYFVGWAWLALSLAVFQAHRFVPKLWPRRWAIVGGIVTIGAWFMAYVDAPGWSSFEVPALMHPGLWMAGALAAGLLVMSLRVIRAEPEPLFGSVFGLIGAVLAVALVFWSTTLEVGRIAEMTTDQEMSRRAAVSIWWGVFAIGLIGVGFWRRIPVVRHCGLALLAVATSKAVIFDLVDVPAVWRAVSFLALGLMMLAVGLVYAKVSASVGGEEQG